MGESLNVTSCLEEIATTATCKGQTIQINAICLDCSKSMTIFGDLSTRVLNDLLRNLETPIHETKTFAMVMEFGSQSAVIVPLAHAQQMPRFLKRPCSNLTKLYQTLCDVFEHLFAVHNWLAAHGINTLVSIYVLSDGVDNCSEPDSEAKILKYSDLAKQLGWSLFTFGFGNKARDTAFRIGFTAELAKTYAPLDPDGKLEQLCSLTLRLLP
ncbi:MAG: vWA domain-containing protein [Patescibacteria group bacterium]